MANASLDVTADLVTMFSLPIQMPPPRPLERAVQELGLKKRCRRCREHKPAALFVRESKARDGLKCYCTPCRNKDARARHHANLERKRLRSAKHRLRTYGLTEHQFSAMVAGQGGGCAICGDVLRLDKTTHVDHCHKTGRVRAILCMPCNSGVGLVEQAGDKRVEAFRAYLRKHQTYV